MSIQFTFTNRKIKEIRQRKQTNIMTQDVEKTNDEQILATIQQEYKILAEYKMIESEKIGGVYVIPSFANSLLWYGVIFMRQGYYKDGIFRFTILLPEKFPDEPISPTVIFQNEIIHPLICPYTGTLDIGDAFPQWRTGEDHIWQLLKYIQSIFIEPQDCVRLNADIKFSNTEAIELITQRRSDFIARCKDCVALSKERIYDVPPSDDPHYITFEKFNEETHTPVLESIRKGKDLPNSVTTTTSSGLSWVKEGEFKALSENNNEWN